MDRRASTSLDEGPPYEVVLIEMDADREAQGHEHVTFVHTNDPDGGVTRWTSVETIAAIRDGERFLVGRDAGGNESLLAPTLCPACPFATLAVDRPPMPIDRRRSAPDRAD